MNKEQTMQANDLDSLIGDSHLMMMKAALPYMNAPEQRFISLFVKFRELSRTVRLFEDEEVASMGICSISEEQRPASPADMLETIKPYGTPAEQDFIDLVLNFFQGFQLAGSAAKTVPDTTVRDSVAPNVKSPDNPAGQEEESTSHGRQASRNFRPFGNPMGRMSMEQLKNFMPPEQQSRLETMQMMMSAMQQGS